MDSHLKARAHPIHAQVAVEELELKLETKADTVIDESELLDLAHEPGEPPDSVGTAA